MAKKTTTAENSGRTAGRDGVGRVTKGNPHAWKNGASPNPAGRPKDTITPHLRELVRKQYPGKSETTYGEMVAFALVREAISGNVRAIAECFDRLDGKAKQSIDLSVEDHRRKAFENAVRQYCNETGATHDEAVTALLAIIPEAAKWVN